jgi:hypothetical protein
MVSHVIGKVPHSTAHGERRGTDTYLDGYAVNQALAVEYGPKRRPWDCGRGKREHKANPGKKDVRTGTSLQANRIGIDTHNAIRYPADPPVNPA